jgi:hypothetical protein
MKAGGQLVAATSASALNSLACTSWAAAQPGVVGLTSCATGFTYGNPSGSTLYGCNSAGPQNLCSLSHETATDAWKSRVSASRAGLAAAASLAVLAWSANAYGRPDGFDDYTVLRNSRYEGAYSGQYGQPPQISDILAAIGALVFLAVVVGKLGSMVREDVKKDKRQSPTSIQ